MYKFIRITKFNLLGAFQVRLKFLYMDAKVVKTVFSKWIIWIPFGFFKRCFDVKKNLLLTRNPN